MAEGYLFLRALKCRAWEGAEARGGRMAAKRAMSMSQYGWPPEGSQTKENVPPRPFGGGLAALSRGLFEDVRKVFG